MISIILSGVVFAFLFSLLNISRMSTVFDELGLVTLFFGFELLSHGRASGLGIDKMNDPNIISSFGSA